MSELEQWTIETYIRDIGKHEGAAILLDNDIHITYQQLNHLIDHNAALLHAHVPESSVITIDVALSWRFIPLMLAALKLHRTVIPTDDIHDQRLTQSVSAAFPNALRLDESNVHASGYVDAASFSRLTSPSDPQLADVALLLQTSGTSGYPKLVMLTHKNLVSSSIGIADSLHLLPHDRILIQRPLTYCSALTGELLAGLAAGCSVMIKPPSRSPLFSLSLVEKYRITTIGASPTLFAMLAPHVSKHDLSSLHTLLISGERLTEPLLHTIRSGFPNRSLWNAYGLTEASPRVSCLLIEPDELPSACVGKPLRHVRVAVVDDIGKPVPEGESGHLLVSGPNVMKGYYSDPEQTRSKLHSGWLITGDRGHIRQGMIVIEGRADHMINRAGNNIYPEEIESAVAECPGVCEAFAFGKPHPRRGAEIHVWITRDDGVQTANDVHQHLLQSGVSPKLWPDVIVVRTDLPKTASGKLSRSAISYS
ncbi:long-chain acyl-CoA synthetase [Paenibacillus cellulosilyticus]|uniref:Long-chain acyl-CoA synthetase n=1 Tax=Paenibacillus cellulosilyticus TaxID=375489 RepID=A0A2V2YU87_9BACL|nr:class I adenylate-forming enzyme family protein [Paenibacillus cellulosilyticus]PWW03246.1 long-chain acyl-CoA synthetase [Paenibacillus cellulosilyticus]QKS43731.1 acyl--CoA ligase [Paenibacillus cellulosilyticus]